MIMAITICSSNSPKLAELNTDKSNSDIDKYVLPIIIIVIFFSSWLWF